MNNLLRCLELTKCGFYIGVNQHRDVYEKINTIVEELLVEGDIDTPLAHKIIETDTLVRIQAHKNTPVGFYVIYHYDIDLALKEMREVLESSL